jgi:hypothetical protein
VRTPEFEEEVLERIANEPSTSTHMGTSQSSVCRVLREQNLVHAYHLQRVKGLGQGDFAPRVQFVQ